MMCHSSTITQKFIRVWPESNSHFFTYFIRQESSSKFWKENQSTIENQHEWHTCIWIMESQEESIEEVSRCQPIDRHTDSYYLQCHLPMSLSVMIENAWCRSSLIFDSHIKNSWYRIKPQVQKVYTCQDIHGSLIFNLELLLASSVGNISTSIKYLSCHILVAQSCLRGNNDWVVARARDCVIPLPDCMLEDAKGFCRHKWCSTSFEASILSSYIDPSFSVPPGDVLLDLLWSSAYCSSCSNSNDTFLLLVGVGFASTQTVLAETTESVIKIDAWTIVSFGDYVHLGVLKAICGKFSSRSWGSASLSFRNSRIDSEYSSSLCCWQGTGETASNKIDRGWI